MERSMCSWIELTRSPAATGIIMAMRAAARSEDSAVPRNGDAPAPGEDE
ncbi:MAG: hypothetical protein ACYTFG_06050 [Planctomycetota bacterium]